MKQLKLFGALCLAGSLAGIAVATCLTPLPNRSVEGPGYFESYATGPNNSCLEYYLDVSGNGAYYGNLLVNGNTTSTGISAYPYQVVTAVSSTTVITPTSTYIELVSTGGLVTIGGPINGGNSSYVPIATATAVSGQYVVLFSVNASSPVQISTSPYNGLQGSTTPLVSTSPKVLQFMFDSVQSIWRELHD